MADLAEMQAQLEALRKRRADGVAGYEVDGHRMDFRRDSELAAAIADLESRIAATQGTAIRKVRITSSKGLT